MDACRHYNGNCCKNGQSDNYSKTCQEYECDDRQGYYDRADEILHRYLRIENNQLHKVIEDKTTISPLDSKTKKHLQNLFASRVELLEELIKEIYE